MPFKPVSLNLRKLQFLNQEAYTTVPAITTPPCTICVNTQKTLNCDCRGCKGPLSDIEKEKKNAAYRWSLHPCFCAKTPQGNMKIRLNYAVYPPLSDKQLCWDAGTPIVESVVEFEMLKGTAVSCTCTRRINSLFNYVFFVSPQREIAMIRLSAVGAHAYYHQVVGVIPPNVNVATYAARYVSCNFNDRKKAYVQFSPAAQRDALTKYPATTKTGRKTYELIMRKHADEEATGREWAMPYMRQMCYTFLLLSREWQKTLTQKELGTAYELQLKFLNIMKDLGVQNGAMDGEDSVKAHAKEVTMAMVDLIAAIAFFPHTLHPHRLLSELLPPVPEAKTFWSKIHSSAPALIKSNTSTLTLLSSRLSALEFHTNEHLAILRSSYPKKPTVPPISSTRASLPPSTFHCGDGDQLTFDVSTLYSEKNSKPYAESDCSTLLSFDEFKEWVSIKDKVIGKKEKSGWEKVGGVRARVFGLIGWPKYWYTGKRDDQRGGTTFYK